MHELGLSENDYGIICKDILYDYTKFDEDGVPIEDSKVPKKVSRPERSLEKQTFQRRVRWLPDCRLSACCRCR